MYTTKYFNHYAIPTYAVPALMNDDYSGLNDSEAEMVREFDKSISDECPEGYSYEIASYYPSFNSTPEFGLATDVINIRVYKTVSYTQKIPAIINNKDITDDFDWMHENEYTETQERHRHRLVFWNHNSVCVLTYDFGSHWFEVEIVQSFGNQSEAEDDLIQRIKLTNEFTVDLVIEYTVEEENNWKVRGQFFFIGTV